MDDHYYVASGRDLAGMSFEVNKKIKEGYKPIEGFHVLYIPRPIGEPGRERLYYYQPMMRIK